MMDYIERQFELIERWASDPSGFASTRAVAIADAASRILSHLGVTHDTTRVDQRPQRSADMRIAACSPGMARQVCVDAGQCHPSAVADSSSTVFHRGLPLDPGVVARPAIASGTAGSSLGSGSRSTSHPEGLAERPSGPVVALDRPQVMTGPRSDCVSKLPQASAGLLGGESVSSPSPSKEGNSDA